ncbi:hypothetical protein [Nocardia sp. NPDC058705]|uniref:hypothetical protein n=1 Tax=Nocardia sp. NPDC058705 TaxID=3346609 RepID=UPI0036CE3F9C
MDRVQWFGRIGWVVGLIAGVFGVLLGAVGYSSGIGNASTPEIVLAVGFLVAGTALASVSIWQLVASDRHKRRTFTHGKQRWDPASGAPPHGQPPTPQPSYGTHPGVPHQSYGPPAPAHPRPATPANPYPQPPNPTPPTPHPQAAYTPPSAPIAPTVAQTPEWQTRTRTAHHWLPTGIPYASAPTGVLGSPADLDRDSSATIPVRIRGAVRETIAIEGPIERSLLVARVAQRFGVHKPSEKQQICVLGEVPESLMRATSSGVFVWPSDLDPATWRGFRFTPPTVSRAIDTISAEEIVNAITHVAQRNRPTFDEIIWATLTQFGHERTGAAEDRLEACVTMAVRRGRLARDSDGRYRALT